MTYTEYTTNEAADYLYFATKLWTKPIDVQPRTVKQWCLRGKFPGARLIGAGRRALWLIPQPDLDALIAAKESRKK